MTLSACEYVWSYKVLLLSWIAVKLRLLSPHLPIKWKIFDYKKRKQVCLKADMPPEVFSCYWGYDIFNEILLMRSMGDLRHNKKLTQIIAIHWWSGPIYGFIRLQYFLSGCVLQSIVSKTFLKPLHQIIFSIHVEKLKNCNNYKMVHHLFNYMYQYKVFKYFLLVYIYIPGKRLWILIYILKI